MLERVARQLARRGHQLGLVHQAEPQLRGAARARLPDPHDVVATERIGERLIPQRRHRPPRRRPRGAGLGLEQRHAALHVERGAHARQRQPELDQRDRDRRLHADHDRLGVEDPRHGGDVGDHPADERVHHFQRGDVDQHAVRAGRGDPLGEVVLQRQRRAGRACPPGW